MIHEGNPAYYDKDTGTWYICDPEGDYHPLYEYSRNQVIDPDTLEWTNEVSGPGGVVSGTGADVTAKYKLSDMASTGDPTYYGYVDADGAWYIMEINTALGTARYVKGASNYTTSWTGRAGLTYGYFNAVF